MAAGDDPFNDDPFVDAPVTSTLPPQQAPARAAVGPNAGRHYVLLAAVVACSVVFGWAVYSLVSGLAPSSDGLAHVSFWSWALVLPVLACLTALILCIIATVRTGGRSPVAWVATVLALTLPLVAGYIGGRLGADEAVRHFGDSLETLTELGTPLLQWLLRILGVD